MMAPAEILTQRVPADVSTPVFVNRADRRAAKKAEKQRSVRKLSNRRVNKRK